MFSISSSSCCCVRLWVPYAGSQRGGSGAEVRGGGGTGAYLEGEMLEKVRGAICLVSLCAGAGVDPHADGRGLGVGRVLRGDLEREGWSIGARGLGRGRGLTVRPFLSVVVCVVMPGAWCGVARPRRGTARPAARPRRPCDRFRASLRDAMADDWGGGGGRGE